MFFRSGVRRGPVVKCATCHLEAPRLNRPGSSGSFRGSGLGQNTSEPQLCTGETKIHEFVSCRRDTTEIMLKWCKTQFNVL